MCVCYHHLQIAGFTWYYIVAADITAPYNLMPSELPPSSTTFPKTSLPLSLAFRYDLKGDIYEAKNFTSYSSISIPICGRNDFQYWAVAPWLPGTEVAFVGELDKVVSVSESRIQNIVHVNGEYHIHIVGAPGETVKMTVYRILMDTSSTVTCQVSSFGAASLHITSNGYDIFCD